MDERPNMKLERWSEHFGSVIATIGFGIMVINVLLGLSFHPMVWLVACCCVAIGLVMVRAAKRRRLQKSLHNDKHEAS